MSKEQVNILITGSSGFIGKNLVVRLRELKSFSIFHFTRNNGPNEIKELMKKCEIVVHLAGVNRPNDMQEFEDVNIGLTQKICDGIASEYHNSGKKIKLLYASSTQAEFNNPYGHSKKRGEQIVAKLADTTGTPAFIYRLPGIFGKWCEPNYNSVVATFCYNISRGLPISISDENAEISLVYIDDLVDSFISKIYSAESGVNWEKVQPIYSIKLGKLAAQINSYKSGQKTLLFENVGYGLGRALYATYMSYLPKEHFTYNLDSHGDERGNFVEIVKSNTHGQVSFFTALPGVTRGGHYHHTKCEKFLVIKGEARFGFRHILTDEFFEIKSNCREPKIIETIPGWSHDIKNIGDEELIVILWANENFDENHPDTIQSKV